MSNLNKPSSSLLSSTADDDQIELDENIYKSNKAREDQQSVNRLIQQPETDQSSKLVAKKDIIVRFEELGKFRTFLNKMSKAKYLSFLFALLVAVLVTFSITKYTSKSGSSCDHNDKKEHSSDEFSPKNQTIAQRLPTNLLPVNYHLKLQPFLRPDHFNFTGTVLILVTCKVKTNSILLNANELEIHQSQVIVTSQTNKTELKINKFDYKNEVLELVLNEQLQQNENYTINIKFKGHLTTSLSGFYRSSYFDPLANDTRYLAMTQFQATDARRAFPCFDEPSFKATFELEMIHWSNMSAIANMPIKEELPIDSEWKLTKFDKTVRMSTYLVAFAVGEFAFKEGDPNSKPKYRIVTRKSENDHATEAIIFGPKILAHFEKYFNIEFPLPKIDMLATPDFSAGAMENWGLITYREAYLLYDKNVGSVVQLYRICSVIAHELAHQWSGNLVTPQFWDDLWLNEGFATFISYEGVNSVKPNWEIWDRFVLDEVHDVLSLDSLKNSHPISVKVNDPNEISELFDHISYAKGASIIRMMTYIIGIETFKEGMHNYLNAFKYSNANQDDLWRYLQIANDRINKTNMINVKEIMDSWTLKEGYPLVTVSRNYGGDQRVRFSQKRFLLNGKDEDELIKTQYEVPISFTTGKNVSWNPLTKLWLHKTKNQSESYVVQEIDVADDEWIIANIKEVGYYRVTYDERNWNLLVDQLLNDPTRIHRINRAQILDDLFHLAENGVVKYSLALRALEYFKKEREPLTWSSIGSLTYLINRMLRRTDIYGSWQTFVRDLIETTYDEYSLNIKIDEDDLQRSQMQKAVVNIACAYNLKKCVDSSIAFMNNFRSNIKKGNNTNEIPPNVRPAVYCTAIFNGGESEWDFIFDLYRKEQNANERNAMLSALTCSRVPWILNRYLKRTFNESSGIKTQDAVFIFKGISSQNYGKDIAFNFLRENWLKIFDIHGKQMSFAHIVKSLDSINLKFELDLVKGFYRSVGNRVGSAKRAFLQTIEQIESNVIWMEKYENEIGDFLRSKELERQNSGEV